MAGFRYRGARRRIGQYVEHTDRAKVRQGVALRRCSSSLVQFPRYSIELRNQVHEHRIAMNSRFGLGYPLRFGDWTATARDGAGDAQNLRVCTPLGHDGSDHRLSSQLQAKGDVNEQR